MKREKMISDRVKKGLKRAPNRSLLKACGYTDEELEVFATGKLFAI